MRLEKIIKISMKILLQMKFPENLYCKTVTLNEDKTNLHIFEKLNVYENIC